ncbi:MAG: c-type cytochrome [Xanthomonadales bacterium]|nr:c-type cytochrome [Gammaproteobacteria bacterium]MBT8073666.1 c-type cytochrome [Gammaproteobacteria bacterium]NNK04510.1 c-type cytochrome [Xanthomonadales bacterium]NNK99939.1 c-type cytochrome [Xanthomonadales bacterium]
MSRLANRIFVVSLLVAFMSALPAWADSHGKAGQYGIGKAATAEEIAGWDIDIRPDGKGLPPGSGSVEDGEMMYEEKCASCHGSFGEGVGRYPVLSGGEGSLTEPRPEKTVGSYWPYASTLWDYIHRAMPFTQPQSMSDDEVYAITAYVLYLNDLVEDDFVLTAETFTSIEMPNQDGFFLDDRPDTENTTCMEDCKDPASVKILSEPTMVTLAAQEDVAVTEETSSVDDKVYRQACQMCHAAGVAGAPMTGDKAAWAPRLEQGREKLLTGAIEGIGIMPAKGGQKQLSDQEVATALDYMIEQVKQD